MRVIDATIELRSSIITLRTGRRYEFILTDGRTASGKLAAFCIDGNALVHVVIEISKEKSALIFGRDIDDIRRQYVH